MKVASVIDQAHETFMAFTGDLAVVTQQFKNFSVREDVQIKSISLIDNILSVGYIKGERYPVHLEVRNVSVKELDQSLEALAQECDGDVICHSLFLFPSGIMGCLFLVQGE